MNVGVRYLKEVLPDKVSEIELTLTFGRKSWKWRLALTTYFRLVTLKQELSKEDGCLYQRWDKYQSRGARKKVGGSKFHEHVSYKSYICTKRKESMS